MKRQIFFLILICAAVLFGCTKEGLSGPDGSNKNEPLNSKPIGYVMSMDEVRALALCAPSIYSSDPNTKTKVSSIKEIVPLTSLGVGVATTTRAAGSVSEVDALMNNIYIVNYENNAGFVVISADNRLPDILACSDNGSIPQSIEEIEVPGVVIFFETLPAYAEQEIERAAALSDDYNPYPDSLPDSDGYYRLNYRMQYGPWTYAQSGPVLGTNWDQGEPYNRLTPYCYEHQMHDRPTGCVATAMAQIMAYHRYPTTVHSDKLNRDVTLNWNSILSSPKLTGGSNSADIEAVSALMEVIGTKVNMNYTCSSSGAYSTDVPRALYNMGYTCDNFSIINSSSALKDYVTRTVCERVTSFPVYIKGRDVNRNVGHAWVVDGCQYRVREYLEVWDLYNIDMEFVGTESRLLYNSHDYSDVHCNWGWGGSLDGFFTSGVFDVGASSYTSEMKMITGIKPR